MAEFLHDKSVVIDGLVISKWNRSTFEAMHRGGITAANCTCCIWEGFEPSMMAIAEWQAAFARHADIIRQVFDVADIHAAKREKRVGIILGWQNSSGFGDDLRTVPLFHRLGLRVVQLTYHTANAVGCGCLETRDGGLTDFGRELVDSLNRHGILVDLSHVGAVTSREAILASRKPVAYTHCAPLALKDHPRNKPDEDLRFIAEHGGLVGVTMFPPFMAKGNDSTLDDYIQTIEHVIGVCGEEAVAIGSDFTQGLEAADIEYLLHDKGHARRLLASPTAIVNPPNLATLDEFPNLTVAMERAGWSVTRTERILGGNWLRIFGEVWT